MALRWKNWVITGVQWGITIVSFWVIAREVSWNELFILLKDLNYVIIIAIGAVTIFGFGTQFFLWWVLLNEIEKTPFSTVVRVDLVIKFINHIIPSKASGHSIAPLVIKHYTQTDWTDAVTISGLNTGLYATLYGIVSFCGLVLFFQRLPKALITIIFFSSLMYAVVGLLVFFAGHRLEIVGRIFNNISENKSFSSIFGNKLNKMATKFPSFTEESASTFRTLLSDPTVVIPYTLAWVGKLAVFPGIRVALLLIGLGGSFTPLWLLPIVLVMGYSVTVLPLTPGGVGVAEASATLLLVSLGINQEVAVAVILVDRVFGVYFPALFGAIPMADIDLMRLISNEK